MFAVYALSYRIGACKPEAAIFHAAAELAGGRPEEIFFVDDMAETRGRRRAVGFDAVQFTTARPWRPNCDSGECGIIIVE